MNTENTACAECGMHVEPDDAFHPGIYCRLYERGVNNPAAFLQGYRFIPDPAAWGEDGPRKQRIAAGVEVA